MKTRPPSAALAAALAAVVALLATAPAAADAVRRQQLNAPVSAKLASAPPSRLAEDNIKRTSDLSLKSRWGYDSSWNRYAYVENNPLAFLDPDGEATVSVRSRDRQHAMMQYRAAEFVATGGLISGGSGAASRPALGLGKRLLSKVKNYFSRNANAAKRSQLLKNAAQGKAAEQAVAVELTAEGKDILGSQVTVNTSEGKRVIDHLVSEGVEISAVEVKSGNATRSSLQIAKDEAMASEGAKVVGKNAPAHLRGISIRIETEVRKPIPR